MSALRSAWRRADRLLAQLFRKDDDFNIIPLRKPIENPKRCRAGLTINVKFGSHCKFSSQPNRQEFYADL